MPFPFDPMLIEEAARTDQMHGRTSDALALSTAISLKRIADVMQGFGRHPDNANAYGETGMQAVIGELGRFKNEVLNDVSAILHNRR